MKKYILLGLLICSLGALCAQSSGNCVQGISTDPDNPVKSNPTDPVFHENTFDWRQEFYPTRTSYDCNMEVDGIENPYYEGSDNLLAIHRDAFSDFQPADGWELIKRDFGYLMQPGQMSYSTASSNGGTFKNPYLILYNRFRGELRVFAALPFNAPGQEVVISLNLENSNTDNYTDHNSLNGLFSQSTAVARPLDQKTMVITMASPTAYPDICDVFFYADFHVAYDPCVCYFKSMLEVTFEWVETATFAAVGQGVGVTQDLASALNSGFDPSEIMANFWADPYTDPNNPTVDYDSLKTGTYIHARAWELYEAHMKKEEAKGNFDVAGALYFLAMVAKVGAVIATKGAAAPILVVSSSTAKFGAIGSASIVTSTATVAAAKKFTLAKALKVAAPIFDFLSTEFKEDKPAEMLPMAIEFELALKGRIENTTPLESKTVRLGVPGSQGAENLPEEGSFNQPAYPTYNEALGVFSVLATPEVEVFQTSVATTTTIVCNEPPGEPKEYRQELDEAFTFRLNAPIEYAINPAAKLDLDETEILAALVIKMPQETQSWQYSLVTSLENLTTPTDQNTYVSPFLPLSCLEEVTMRISREHVGCETVPNPSTFSVNIMFLNRYFSEDPGSNGEHVQTMQVLTYPVSLTTTTSPIPLSENIPFEVEVQGPQTGDIKAWEEIRIVGDISTSGSIQVIAGAKIDVSPDVDVSPGFEFITSAGNLLNCGADNLPATSSEIATFCSSTSSAYQANQAARKEQFVASPKPSPVLEEKLKDLTLTAQPNPFSDELTLNYELPAEAQVQMQLVDMMGRPVRQILPSSHRKAGQHEIQVNLSDLASGMYTVILQVGEMRQTVKVVKR